MESRKWKSQVNKKTITFEETEEVSSFLGQNIYPSSNRLPEWFKQTKAYSTGTLQYTDYLKAAKQPAEFAGTFKRCIPVQDAMTSGYMVTLPATVLVTQRNGFPYFEWKTKWNPIDAVTPRAAISTYPVPEGYSPVLFRWYSNHKILTPPGYSILLTHPHHRYDLPFITLSGVVDVDAHDNPVLMPFFIRKGFEGFIEEGTPIAQVLPFKRDNWVSEIKPFKTNNGFGMEKVRKYFDRGYKARFWSKKQYL